MRSIRGSFARWQDGCRRGILALTLAALLALYGCTSSASESVSGSFDGNDNEYTEIYDADSGYYDKSTTMDAVSPSVSTGSSIGGSSLPGANTADNDADTAADTELNPEKLVYTATVELETKDFDNAVEQLSERLLMVGGIIQNENFYDDTPWEYYYGEYDETTYRKVSGYKRLVTTVRIPTASFDAFLDDVGGIGHVTNSSSYVSNITQEYYSTKSYLESYQNQLEVLLGMYEQCETIDEMITVEQRISEVQAEINQLTTRISSLDRDVAYSTVTITLSEVAEYSDTPREQEEKSFGQKVLERIVNSWDTMVKVLENLLYFLIDIMWLLIFIGVILVLVITINRRRRKALMAKGVIDEYGRPIYKKPGETSKQEDQSKAESDDNSKQ